MALIVRIDVDRPYGRQPLPRHVLSRLSSDLYFPRIESFGYLKELDFILNMMNSRGIKSYVFFRRCTLPSQPVLKTIRDGGHKIGLHLENSRTFETFIAEKRFLEAYIGERVTAISKHGSGSKKYGFHHYAPYEPEKYIDWAQRDDARVFLGNLEDPTLPPSFSDSGFCAFPSAFWIEPAWRNTEVFTVSWLESYASQNDAVLLLHPENVLSNPGLTADFERLLDRVETRTLH
jgi:hypothetical protein